MENYLYRPSQDIAETLDEADILIPFTIMCGPSAMLSVICDDDTPDIAIRLFGLLNDIPVEKRDAVSKACNMLNNIIRYYKFALDEDGDVYMAYDLPLATSRSDIGYMVLEMFSKAHSILDEYYNVLCKAVYIEETQAVSFDFSSIHDILHHHHDPDDYMDVDEID